MWSSGRLSWSTHTHTKHTVCTAALTYGLPKPLPPPGVPRTSQRDKKRTQRTHFCKSPIRISPYEQDFYEIKSLLSNIWNPMFENYVPELSVKRKMNWWQITNAWLSLSPQTPQWWLHMVSHLIQTVLSHNLVMFTGISLTLKIHKSTCRYLLFSEAVIYSFVNFLPLLDTFFFFFMVMWRK